MIELSATADQLLEELKAEGIKLSFNNGKLRVQGELSDYLKEQVLKNKEGLIQLVKLGEHRWRKVEEWEFRREGNRMIGKRGRGSILGSHFLQPPRGANSILK